MDMQTALSAHSIVTGIASTHDNVSFLAILRQMTDTTSVGVWLDIDCVNAPQYVQLVFIPFHSI